MFQNYLRNIFQESGRTPEGALSAYSVSCNYQAVAADCAGQAHGV